MIQRLVKLKKKLTDHTHDKYITIPEFNKATVEYISERLKQANLITKKDLDNKLISFNRKIVLNKKRLLQRN